MKKLLCFFLCAALCALALAGCGGTKLPDGVTEEAATGWAQQTVEALNAKDYESLTKQMTEDMQKAMSQDTLAKAWEPYYEAVGAFDKIEKTTLVTKDGYVVAVVQAVYANQKAVFTLSYTPNGLLGGLYFK